MATTSAKRKRERRGFEATSAPAHLALAEALTQTGRLAEAVAAYESAAESDPRSLAAWAGLARARAALGLAEDAFAAADRALALDAASLVAWEAVALGLEGLGETAFAAAALNRALTLAPDRADLKVRLGALCEALDRPVEAAARYREAISSAGVAFADALAAYVALSGLYGRAGQWDPARAAAEAALRLDPASRSAHQNLAAIADSEGRLAEAEAHRERAFRGRPLIVTRAARPRRRVLVLASAARANTPDAYLAPLARYDRLVWFLAYAGGEEIDPESYDVVFNAIADADVAQATRARAEAFLAACPRPSLNPPAAIAATARDEAARLFAGLDDLVVPRTLRVAGDGGVSELLGEWLLRPVGAHGGERLARLSAPAAAAAIAASGGTHYLTAFHDFRSPDGLYRKYRVFFVDRRPYPYHLAIHDDWLVHYQRADMAGHPARLDEERAFLQDPARAIGARAWGAVVEAGRRLDLDYAGMDFAVAPCGRAFLFEANATMLAHPEAPEGPLAFKTPYVETIFRAFQARLEGCGEARRA